MRRVKPLIEAAAVSLLLCFASCPAQAAARDPLRFVFLGDLHYQQPRYSTQRLVEAIASETNTLDPPVDFVCHTGDFIHGQVTGKHVPETLAEARSEWDFASQHVLKAFGRPFFAALGNHDWYGDTFRGGKKNVLEAYIPFMAGQLGRELQKPFFSFDRGQSHFVFLNHCYFDAEWDREQMAWLDRDLAQAKNYPAVRHIFVFGHPELWNVSTLMFDERRRYTPLLTKHAIDAYFCGHVHRNTVSVWDFGEQKLTQIVGVPSLGGEFVPIEEGELVLNPPPSRRAYYRGYYRGASYYLVSVQGSRVTVQLRALGKGVAWEFYWDKPGQIVDVKTPAVKPKTVLKAGDLPNVVEAKLHMAHLAPSDPAAPVLFNGRQVGVLHKRSDPFWRTEPFDVPVSLVKMTNEVVVKNPNRGSFAFRSCHVQVKLADGRTARTPVFAYVVCSRPEYAKGLGAKIPAELTKAVSPGSDMAIGLDFADQAAPRDLLQGAEPGSAGDVRLSLPARSQQYVAHTNGVHQPKWSPKLVVLDRRGYVEYEFPVLAPCPVTVRIHNQCELRVRANGKKVFEYTERRAPGKVAAAWPTKWYELKLPRESTAAGSLSLRLEDPTPNDGWGPNYDQIEVIFHYGHNVQFAVERLLPCQFLADPPRIDGELDDAAWRGSEAVSLVTMAGQRPQVGTRAWVCRDAASLYVAFECSRKKGDTLRADASKRDGMVYLDDCVEVFLDVEHTHKRYFHFALNFRGVLFDEHCSIEGKDAAWNAVWRAKTSIGDAKWRAEIEIPFAALGGPPAQGQTWGINLCRERPDPASAGQENSCWSPTHVNFHQPEQFGDVLFGPRSVTPVAAFLGREMLGSNEARTVLRNHTGQALTVKAEVQGTGIVVGGESKAAPVPAGQFATVVVPYRLRAPGTGEIRLRVWEPGSGRTLYIGPALCVDVPELRAQVTALMAQAGLFHQRLARLPVAGDAARQVAGSVSAFTSRAADLAKERTRLASSPTATRPDWLDLRTRLAETRQEGAAIETQIGTYEALADKGTVTKALSFGVAVVDNMTKVRRGEPLPSGLGRQASLAACRNEHEGFQVVVCPFQERLARLRLSVSPLRTAGGAAIPASQVRYFAVGYIGLPFGVQTEDVTEWWPDPLLPGEPVNTSGRDLRVFWVDVHVPADAKPGKYRGQVTVFAENSPEVAVPIRLRVHDFALPHKPLLRTHVKAYSDEAKALMVAHRLSPGFVLYPKMPKGMLPFEQVRPMIAKGLDRVVAEGWNTFMVEMPYWPGMHQPSAAPGGDGGSQPKTYSEEQKAYIAQYYRQYQAYLDQRGLTDEGYIYLWDEPPSRLHESIRDLARVVHEAAPKLRRLVTTSPKDDLAGAVDIWVPLTPWFTDEHLAVADKRRAAGEQVWCYIACGPRHPYASFALVTNPLIESRLLFWQVRQIQADGFLYWTAEFSYGDFSYDPSTSRCLFAKPSHYPPGDGILVYHPRGRTVGCIRLEAIRDGVEDWEYLAILEREVARVRKTKLSPAQARTLEAAARLLHVSPAVSKGLKDYTRDPQVMRAAREDIARAIIAVQAMR